jgi:8-amino-7-oxononanoate synthase
MLNFTSALYLGLQHSSRSLRAWNRLSAGAPAALHTPAGAATVAAELAMLQGIDAATLATSTLHVFWDLFGMLGGDRKVAIHIDAGAYPVARWGVERAACRGAEVHEFGHHDADGLARSARAAAGRGCRPIVVADGICPACGRTAPLPRYVDVARRHGGHLVIDDTQALGVLGEAPGPLAPYGHGGGGAARWHAIAGPELIVVSSLAKGFGVPLAALTGTREFVASFEARSQTRVHSSPPSVANLRGAEHALALNRAVGDSLRLRLARRVMHFRARIAELGLRTLGGLFPMQTLSLSPMLDATVLHRRLLDRRVAAVLHRPRSTSPPLLSLLITARHRFAEIDAAIDALAESIVAPARASGEGI